MACNSYGLDSETYYGVLVDNRPKSSIVALMDPGKAALPTISHFGSTNEPMSEVIMVRHAACIIATAPTFSLCMFDIHVLVGALICGIDHLNGMWSPLMLPFTPLLRLQMHLFLCPRLI